MNVDELLDAHAHVCRHSIHDQPDDAQTLIRRARERKSEGVKNPPTRKLAELVEGFGGSMSPKSIEGFMSGGCSCES